MTVNEAFEFVYDTLENKHPEAYEAMHIIANAYEVMKETLEAFSEIQSNMRLH